MCQDTECVYTGEGSQEEQAVYLTWKGFLDVNNAAKSCLLHYEIFNRHLHLADEAKVEIKCTNYRKPRISTLHSSYRVFD